VLSEKILVIIDFDFRRFFRDNGRDDILDWNLLKVDQSQSSNPGDLSQLRLALHNVEHFWLSPSVESYQVVPHPNPRLGKCLNYAQIRHRTFVNVCFTSVMITIRYISNILESEWQF
jgi:hypothetical protein